jgi:hypothetical protein
VDVAGNNLLKITDRQLLDYIECPKFFYYKYCSKIPIKASESFHSLLQQVINAYMLKLFDGKILSMDKAKKIWDKLIDENPDVFINDKKIIDGVGYINALDNYCRTNRVMVLDTGVDYQLNFKNNLSLVGKIGTIRYDNNKCELFVVETSQKQPDQILLSRSIKYTLQIYALNKLQKDLKISGVKIWHVKSGKEFLTYRTQKDFDSLEETINSVNKAIRNKIFYPRQSYYCPDCKYKNFCPYM